LNGGLYLFNSINVYPSAVQAHKERTIGTVKRLLETYEEAAVSGTPNAAKNSSALK
jgi:hypothetical protein